MLTHKEEKMKIFTAIAFYLTIIGGLNWLLVGLFNFDLILYLFGTFNYVPQIIYTIVGLSAIWLLAAPIYVKKTRI